MAEWQRKNAWWWSYRGDAWTRPYGYVLRCRTAEMDDAVWAAIRLGTHDSDHTVVARRLSLEGAKQALERYAERHGRGWVRQTRRVRRVRKEMESIVPIVRWASDRE